MRMHVKCVLKSEAGVKPSLLSWRWVSKTVE